MIGKIVSHYRVLEKLGEGGMGEVFLAEDTRLERKIALKFLSKEMTSNKEACKRFEREAKAAASLNHPCIVTVYDINQFEGQTFIAMEYIDGRTLKEMNWIPDRTIIDIMVQVCEGLKEAHQAGIIHRDIKPQNIVLDKNDRAKILDFGLAKLSGASKITQDIFRVGTIQYMSPQQARGEEIDHRTDIWSVGVVIYEMLTGQLPFRGDNGQAVLFSILNESPLPLTEIRENIPVKLEKIVFRCLRKDLNLRYSAMEPLLCDLKELGKRLRLRGGKKDTADYQTKTSDTKKETERRQATVMFIEIFGLDEMQKKWGTEETASVMNNCLEKFGTLVEKYGGRIDKIMEVSLVVLFGIPKAIENAPQKAVNSAIEIRNYINRLHQKNDPKTFLDIRIGINTGLVITGAIDTVGKRDYTIMGDTVTHASRLKDLSDRGQICVGPSTYRYTRNEFEYRQLKPAAIKGMAKSVQAFQLLSTREKAYPAGFPSAMRIYSEMVGRDKELDMLRLNLLKVVNGEGSIVSVTGEAGIGKSRLIGELKRMEDFRKVALFEGRALSIGKNLSYHPIADCLKNWAGIKDDTVETESLYKLEQAIRNIYKDGVGEILPFIASLLGMKLPEKYAERLKNIGGEAMERLILKSLRELMIKYAGLRPLVFIVEDLHWADMSSIELLESLYRLAQNCRILFINLLRPGYEETGDRLLKTIKERYDKICIEINLKALERKQCEFLIRNLVKDGEFSLDIQDTIIERAEGNPFFIEEVVRSFIDEGIVKYKDGKFSISEKIESIVIPETIQGVLMSRIDRLDEKTRILLKDASVIGRYFFYKILVEVARTIEDIDDRLEYLKDVQLIGERMRLDEIEYLFKHALVQEVTYESILFKKRRELHLNVAEAIESVFSERLHEFYGMLALHYSMGENQEKAEEYLIKAGEEALKIAASSEALNYYQEALKIYLKKHGDSGDPDTIAHLEWNIAKAFLNKGHMAKAVAHCDKVLNLWGKGRMKNRLTALIYFITDLVRATRCLYLPLRRGKLIPTIKENDIFEVTYQRGIALASIDTYRMVVDSIRFIGFLHRYDLSRVRNGTNIYASSSAIFSFSGMSFPIARKLLDHALNFIDPGDRKTMFSYTLWEVLFDLLSGNWDRRLDYDENIVNRYLQEGDLFIASGHLFFSGFLEVERGNFVEGWQYIAKLDEIDEAYESDQVRVSRYSLRARFWLKNRRLVDALRDVDAAISAANRADQDLDILDFIGIKANIQILLRDIDGAEQTLQQAEHLISQQTRLAPWHIVSYRLSRFLLHLYYLEKRSEADREDERETVRRAICRCGKNLVKTSKRHAPYRAESFRLMGSYYWLTGRQNQALKWWSRTIRVAEFLGARPEMARTYMEVGRRLREGTSSDKRLNGVTAEEYLEKARLLFQEMDLEWDLHELNKIGN